MARENSWGYSRIHGELKKLGLDKISRTTVANILREAGMDPAPERSKSTWMEFVKRHADTLFACDFFTKRVWTLTGLRTYYILFFIHIATRRVHFGGFTTNPDRAWMTQQAPGDRRVFRNAAAEADPFHPRLRRQIRAGVRLRLADPRC